MFLGIKNPALCGIFYWLSLLFNLYHGFKKIIAMLRRLRSRRGNFKSFCATAFFNCRTFQRKSAFRRENNFTFNRDKSFRIKSYACCTTSVGTFPNRPVGETQMVFFNQLALKEFAPRKRPWQKPARQSRRGNLFGHPNCIYGEVPKNARAF